MGQYVGGVLVMLAPSPFAQPSCDHWAWAQSMNVPPGLFASWSEEDKRMVPKRIAVACTLTAGDMFSDYHGFREAMVPAMRYIAAACYSHAVPEDCPGRSAARDSALPQYAIAKQSDPTLPDPDLP